MSQPISAIESRPADFIKEVSSETLTYFVQDLSGLYLPDVFKEQHAETIPVKYWGAEDRLSGKFGRFAVKAANGSEDLVDPATLSDILLMGTTIDLGRLNGYGRMASLRHYEFKTAIQDVAENRGWEPGQVLVAEADYGGTNIQIDDEGQVRGFSVYGYSIDFGRADEAGRQQTVDLFQDALGPDIRVQNSDPKPDAHDKIIECDI